MKLDDVPRANFWPYDLFGYLLPGAALLTAMALGSSWASRQLVALWDGGHIQDYVLLGFIAYFAGTCISATSSLIIEAGLMQYTYGYPTSRLIPDRPATVESGRALSWLKKTPVWAVARWCGSKLAPNWKRPFPPKFQDAVRNKYREIFGDDFEDSHTRFWTCWAYISLHHPAAFRRGTHFVELYGFSRNSALSFFLIALLPFFGCWGFSVWRSPIAWWAWSVPSLLMALFFFANYLKMFKRLDIEVFHAFLASSCAPLKASGGED